MVGIWEPGTHQGFGVMTEAGAPSWFELFTRDHAAAVSFYRNVFRWDTETMGDTDEFRYTTLKRGDDMLAGIMDATAFLPEGVPAHWSVYFGSDDTDATLARTVELGGSIVVPAEDTPYGRLATAADPTGAIFKLVAPNEQMPAKQ
jgi:predicted enzyme related to lactoylglutathione lyase